MEKIKIDDYNEVSKIIEECEKITIKRKEDEEKYTNQINNLVVEDIIDYDICEKKSYKFGKKELYMVHIERNSFKEENIKRITNRYNWENKIQQFIEKITQKITKHYSASKK